MSWVTNSTVARRSSQIPSTTSYIMVRVCASREPNGSSISNAFGELASARDADALLHAAREGLRIIVCELGEPDHGHEAVPCRSGSPV
jgi:hypothetical protein